MDNATMNIETQMYTLRATLHPTFLAKIIEKCLRCSTIRSQMFFKVSVRKDFANFTGKHLYWGIFSTSLKRDPNTGVFL